MIDIIPNNKRNLKNIRQIGTPSEEDKIYIENSAYERIHEEDYADRRIFIFMGHTECEEGKYTTFVEAAIPVRDIDFQQNVPQWNNHAWSDIFREIKRSYENSIIVGWGMDIKGFAPRMTPELESVHREQFGGAHQVLFLMDSIEGEEYFFINKGNCLQKREGFYIYYCPKLQEMRQAEVSVEMPEDVKLSTRRTAGKEEKVTNTEAPGYRASLQQKEEKRSERKASSYAMTAAILLLIGIVGAGVYQDRIILSRLEKVISTMGVRLEKVDKSDAEVLVGTEIRESVDLTESTQEDLSETLTLIPVKELPSGDIKAVEETQTEETDADEKNTAETSAEMDADVTTSEGAGADATAETSSTAEAVGTQSQDSYTVQPGDTLTSICKSQYGSSQKIQEVAELNHLQNLDDIRVGQKLLLP